MGYSTTYSLKWDCKKSKTTWDEISDEIQLRQDAGTDFFYAVDAEGRTTDSCKWYDHEAEIAKFSKIYPDVLFELSGEGEESGDIWKKYFRDGKMQRCDVEMTFPPFDETKLDTVRA
jgi:hypothetical protein